MTNNEKIKKIFEYRQDLKKFISDNIYLELPGGAVKFQPYKRQFEVIDDFTNLHNLLFIKSRQIGISTIVQAIIVSCIVLYSNVTVGVISKDGPEATDFVKKIKEMIANLPEWIRPKFKKQLEQDIQLTNGSRVVASCVNAHKPTACLRGKSITILVIDEAAFIDYINDAYTGMIPAVSKNQQVAKANGIPYGIFIISTPNKTVGIGKWYFDMYSNSKVGKNAYKLVEIYWRDIEGLNNEWYQHQCELANWDQDKIDQELEMKFISSSDSIFNKDIQMWLQDDKNFPKYDLRKIELELKREEDVLIPKLEVEVKIFEDFNPIKKYMICVDTASEAGACKSAILVLDRFSLKICASYTGNLRVQFLAELVKKLSDIYLTSYLIIENNSYGDHVIEELTIIPKYEKKIYYTKDNKNKETKRAGIATTPFTRPLIIDSMLSYVKDKYKEIRCQELGLQLLGLVRSNSNDKIKHGNRTLDDLVMALGLGCYVYCFNLLEDANLTIEEIQFMNKMFANGEADIETINNTEVNTEDDPDNIDIDTIDKLFK
jgi:hypothetical protein